MTSADPEHEAKLRRLREDIRLGLDCIERGEVVSSEEAFSSCDEMLKDH